MLNKNHIRDARKDQDMLLEDHSFGSHINWRLKDIISSTLARSKVFLWTHVRRSFIRDKDQFATEGNSTVFGSIYY